MLELLRSEQKCVGFITNNSRNNAYDIVQKLKQMDITIAEKEVITTTEMAGLYVKEKYGLLRIYVVGSEMLKASVEKWGHIVIDPTATTLEKTEAVIIGRDTEFTFEKLQTIVDLAGQGARVIATNSDLYHPGKGDRRVLETGALVASIRAVIDQPVEFVGKPYPFLYETGLRLYGTTPQECVMIGDNLFTDIAGAQQAGIKNVWIRGKGVNVKNTLSNPQPDFSVKHMEELLNVYSQL